MNNDAIVATTVLRGLIRCALMILPLAALALVLTAFDTKSAPMPTQSRSGSTAGIRGVDFLNFDYSSDCWEQYDDFPRVIHASKGSWQKENVGVFGILNPLNHTSSWMITYGDLKGEPQRISTQCL